MDCVFYKNSKEFVENTRIFMMLGILIVHIDVHTTTYAMFKLLFVNSLYSSTTVDNNSSFELYEHANVLNMLVREFRYIVQKWIITHLFRII